MCEWTSTTRLRIYLDTQLGDNQMGRSDNFTNHQSKLWKCFVHDKSDCKRCLQRKEQHLIREILNWGAQVTFAMNWICNLLILFNDSKPTSEWKLSTDKVRSSY